MIPTFRPDAADLITLAIRLAPQVTQVVVADDASPCTADSALRALVDQGVTVRRHRHNSGIARSLNEGLAVAREYEASWLLTLDQDTLVGSDYVAGLMTAVTQAILALGDGAIGAIAAGSLNDASGEIRYPVKLRRGIHTTQEVFQTGTLWSTPALTAIGGFDEEIGIDAVDAMACLKLRQKGLVIAVDPQLRLEHHYGAGTQYNLLGRQVISTGHSPDRRESMVRNRLKLFPAEFAQSPVHALRTIRRVGVNAALGATVEPDRWANIRGSARGLLHRKAR